MRNFVYIRALGTVQTETIAETDHRWDTGDPELVQTIRVVWRLPLVTLANLNANKSYLLVMLVLVSHLINHRLDKNTIRAPGLLGLWMIVCNEEEDQTSCLAICRGLRLVLVVQLLEGAKTIHRDDTHNLVMMNKCDDEIYNASGLN